MVGPANSINESTTGITGFTGTAFVGTPVTNHAVIVGGSTSSTLTNVGPTATAGQVLQSAGSSADPAFSTATFPATATGTGTILRADGTNWVATTATYPATTTVSQLLYSSATNVVGGLATANNGTLVTSATGVPSILAGPGTTGNILQSNAAAAPSFSTATYPSTTVVNQLLFSSATNVVGGVTAVIDGVLISNHAAGVPSWLANGTTGQFLTATTGAPPSWTTSSGTGDVVGPGSATDNALARFDGTTGKLIQNGVITEDDTGNLSVAAAVSGATLSATVSNTSNTASSNAAYFATVAGTTANDAFVQYAVSGTTTWTQGIDNSVTGDPYVLAASSALGTTNVMSITTGGAMSRPLHPCFLATKGTTQTNVTGDGTSVTVSYTTEVFDQSSSYDATDTFTAPVTGRYFFVAAVRADQLTVASTNYQLQFTATSGTLFNTFMNASSAQTSGLIIFNASAIINMTAADTCKVTFITSGITKVVDLTTPDAYFGGFLIC